MNCPICGESYVQDQQFCSLCNFELNSKILLPGNFSDAQKVKWETDRNQRIDDFVETVLRLSFKNGIFDEDCFKNGTSHITGFDLSNKRNLFLRSYEINFRNLANQVLQKEISRLVNAEIGSILLLDCDPELLTLCRVVLNGDEFITEFSTINLDSSLVDLDGILKKDIAIVAGYREINSNLVNKLKSIWNTAQKNPTSVLLCSRIFGGKHLIQIKNLLLSNITSNVIDAPYLLGEVSTFREFIGNLLIRAPLPYDLHLLTANVGVDGTVTSASCQIFPCGEFLDSKSITVKSYNHENEIDLVIVKHKNTQRELVQSWKMNLDFGQEAKVIFTKPDRKSIQVSATSEFSIIQTHIDLMEIDKSLPEKVILDSPKTKIDFVLIIDTITDEEELRERCESGKRIIQKLTTEAKDIQFSYSVLAYGDRKTSGEKRSWTDPLRTLVNKTPSELYTFLTNLSCTDVLGCDYESALDEAMQYLDEQFPKNNSNRIILTIGCRPPHPHKEKKLPGTNQKPSQNGNDWQILLKKMKENRNSSYVLLCPETWPRRYKKGEDWFATLPIPGYAPLYRESFWRSYGFTQLLEWKIDNENVIVQHIINQKNPQKLQLKLPVVILI